LGSLDEARATIERLRDITPSVIPGAEHWRVPEQREFFLEGLRLAAGETNEVGTLMSAAERAIDSIREAIHVLAPAPGTMPKAPET